MYGVQSRIHFVTDVRLKPKPYVEDTELRPEYTADLKRLRDKVFGSLTPMQVDGRAVSGRDFALNIERWVLYGNINIDEDDQAGERT